MTKIKNINGNTTTICKCGSWLNHWNKHNNKPAVFCSEIKCTQMFELKGIHVQKFDDDENWFIVPLCEEHGLVIGELMINNFIKLMPANFEETCEKF